MKDWWNRRATWQKVAIGTVAGFILGVGVGGGGAQVEAEDEAPTTTTLAASTTTSSAPEATTTTVPPTTTTPAPTTTLAAYTPESFGVELIVLEDECFNTAGALVTVEHDLVLITGTSPAPGQELTVVYEIHGGENVSTHRIEVTGDSYSYEEHVVSTESCDHNLSTEVVNVIER